MQSPPPPPGETAPQSALSAGFTLIEISIVLVIIGFIVGGVLVGQDLIKAAQVRATITQIEKYNQAANTFYGKYGYLPGDIPAGPAAQFGFVARGQYAGEGDGNGLIEGVSADASSSNNGSFESAGETTMFWPDLAAASLADTKFSIFTYASPTTPCVGCSPSVLMPVAKLGGSNYIYVFSSGGVNYFGISAPTYIGNTTLNSVPALSVLQAYSIDSKVDDGLPQTGTLIAQYINHMAPPYTGFAWAIGGSQTSAGAAPGAVATPSATTCYDNGGSASNPMQYSVEQNGGAGVNCALSFKIQAGDR